MGAKIYVSGTRIIIKLLSFLQFNLYCVHYKATNIIFYFTKYSDCKFSTILKKAVHLCRLSSHDTHYPKTALLICSEIFF